LRRNVTLGPDQSAGVGVQGHEPVWVASRIEARSQVGSQAIDGSHGERDSQRRSASDKPDVQLSARVDGYYA